MSGSERAKAKIREQSRKELDIFLSGRERIEFSTAPSPQVSILIVLFDAAELSLRLFRSLAAAIDVPSEVIVIDNASTDGTEELCARIDGARLIRNPENLHFLRAANQAASLAQGSALLFLNSDVEIPPNAIRHAYRRLISADDIGAVGAKLVLPDGRLQEAGSIVWRDGACVGVGRGRDPSAPEFQFSREVDYCSGAFLMVRRAVFEALGGFDTAFAPAYYEETDLAMRMRRAGYRTIYDPRIAVRHFEFGSGELQSAVALQEKNRALFVARHRPALRQRHFPSEAGELRARMRGNWRGRILVVDDRVPYESLGTGYPRANRMVRALRDAGWFVSFFPMAHKDVNWDDAYWLWPDDIEILAGFGSARLHEVLRERAGYYDVVLVSRAHNMSMFRKSCARAPEFLRHTRLLYDAEAITARREALRRDIEGLSDMQRLNRETAAELALTADAAAVIAVSDADAALFRAATGKPVFTAGHALETRVTPLPFEARSGILFVGALEEDRSPNVDSAIWFVKEVMPRLDALLGEDYVFTLAGLVNAPAAKALAGPRVRLAGRCEDLRAFYDNARLFVAPTRYAAGIPMKVHHAAAHGLPVVLTPLLAGQLSWTHDSEVLVAGGPEEFARACNRLYTDERAWRRLRENALRRVAIDCAPENFEAQLREAIELAFAASPAGVPATLAERLRRFARLR